MIRRARSIRARLTIWYAGVLATILITYAGGVYVFLRQSLYAELDRQLGEDFEAAEEAIERVFERGEPGELRLHRHEMGHHDDEEGSALRWLEVWSREGALLYQERPEAMEIAPFDKPAFSKEGGVQTIASASGGRLRVLSGAHPTSRESVWIRAARSEARIRHELDEFVAGMALGMPAAILLSGLGGYFLAGRALKPVGQMAAHARTISVESLGERLPIENPDDELGELGGVFNETLDRLEQSFETLRRFTSDAAHELRTPLTAMRSVGEVGLTNSKSEAAYRETIGSMLEEVGRLTRLVELLLTLSRADGGRVEIDPEHLDLAAFAREVSEVLEVLAEEKAQAISVEGDADVYVEADPLVLRQAIINLLDNAIRHSPKRASIRVIVKRRADQAILEIHDRGPGIAERDRERIFDRFYRTDEGRARQTGGAGLGLAIARWAVEANGGHIEVESGNGGSCFRVWLPLWSLR